MDSGDEKELDSLEKEIYSLASYRVGLIREFKALHLRKKDLRSEIRRLSDKVREERLSLRDYYAKSQQYEETRDSLKIGRAHV